MAMREFRFRVREGHLQSVEVVSLGEGTEVVGMANVPEAPSAAEKPRPVFKTFDLGLIEPLTREALYEDAY